MRKLAIEYETDLVFSSPVRDHCFQLRCVPPDLPQQRVFDLDLSLEPGCKTFSEVDSFHNNVLVGRIVEPHKRFNYRVSALVFVDQRLVRQTPYRPLYRYQSAFTRQGPLLRELTREVEEEARRSGAVVSPIERATLAMHMVHERLSYLSGTTSVRTTAEEALEGAGGVCQDFAQVMISVCRGMGLLSKYVAGVYQAEGATHAWAEVYQGGRWHGLDPTNDCPVNDSYVKIANGRDYGDCLLEIGVFIGAAEQRQTVHASVTEVATADQ